MQVTLIQSISDSRKTTYLLQVIHFSPDSVQYMSYSDVTHSSNCSCLDHKTYSLMMAAADATRSSNVLHFACLITQNLQHRLGKRLIIWYMSQWLIHDATITLVHRPSSRLHSHTQYYHGGTHTSAHPEVCNGGAGELTPRLCIIYV